MVVIGFLSGIGSAISGSLGGIAGAIGGVASTILGNNSAKHEAEKNRQFQENMSNTSISRRMADLKNAGLNPLLAVENASAGASTPSGSQAQLQQFDPSWITVLSSAKLQKQQGDVAKAEERRVNAEAEAQENENSIFETKARKVKLEADREAQGLELDKLLAKIHDTTNEKIKMEIYKNALEAKGIHISNEKAKEELKLLTFNVESELGFYRDNPEMRDAKIFGDHFQGLYPSLGVLGWLGATSGKDAKDFVEYEERAKHYKKMIDDWMHELAVKGNNSKGKRR